MNRLRAWWRRLVTTRTTHVVERRWLNGRELDPVKDRVEWDRIGLVMAENEKLFTQVSEMFRRM